MDADDKPTPGTDDHISLASRREAFAELADLNDDPPPDETSSEQGEATAISGEGDDVTIVPPVVAVVVVHNAGEWLDEVLESLGAQTYTNLSILVIDAGSDIDPTPRIAEVLPGAFVRRLEHNSGFGPTVNEILELVSGASFYCLCHDDVALDPDALHELVAEAFRSNAGIVGPKLVDWDDPELLTSVGFTVDRSGGRAPYAEHHELDQGQHDAVRDVFAVSGGCTLIRSDLFDHLGGYDPDIDLVGEDLDLCWRAHLVGARVVVAPRARARHRGDLGARIDPERLPGVDAAHRLRTVLTNSRLVRLVVLVPQLLLTTVVEAVVEAVIGRRSHARAQLGAWGANLRRSGSILRARKRVRAIREGNDRTVRQLQTKIRSRLDGLVQTYRRDRAERILAEAGGHATPGRPSDTSGTGRSALSGGEDDSDGFVRVVAPERTHSLVVWGLVAIIVILVVGTRELFFGAIPPIGTFAAPPPSLGELWRVWVGSWNPAGLGSHQSPAAGVGPLALAGTILGGAFGFIRRVAILGPIILGLVGAWRLPRELGSRRAQLVAFVVYAAVPVPWNALSQGVWSGVLAYGIAPWLLRTAVRAMRVEPFGGDGTHADRPWWVTVAGFAPVLAVAIALVPSIALVGAVVLLGLTIGSALIGRFAGVGRMLLVTGGSLIAAVLLLLPWVIVGPGRSLWTLAGVGGGAHGWLDAGRILRFETGPIGAGLIGYGFLVLAALPLCIGRSWRFAWGVRAWTVAVVAFGVVWAGQQHWFDLPTPPPEVLLGVAAIALALAAACGAAAFENDLSSFRFGWAQAATVVATVALVVSVLPLAGNAADGRWRMAPVGLDQALGFVSAHRAEQPFRVLWVGDPAVMPAAGWRLDDGTAVAVTANGLATMDELWAPADPGATRMLMGSLDLATSSETTRLGRVLADAGIRYVVLPRQSVPLPYRSTAHRPSARLVDAMDDQLDLARESANDAVVVYRNEAWRPGRRLLPLGTPVGAAPVDTLDAPTGTAIPGSADPIRTSRFRVPAPGILATGQPADRSWRLDIDGKAAKPVTLWGWEQGFVVPGAGTATLQRDSDTGRIVVLIFMGALWVAVLAAWFVGRRRGEDRDLLVVAHDTGSGPGSFVHLGDRGSTDAVAVTKVDLRAATEGEEIES